MTEHVIMALNSQFYSRLLSKWVQNNTFPFKDIFKIKSSHRIRTYFFSNLLLCKFICDQHNKGIPVMVNMLTASTVEM